MPFLELDVLNNAPQPILGIDLGTTNSLVALFREGRATVLRPRGARDGRIPSAIHFPPDGSAPIVGREARARELEQPGTTLFSVKRLMGRGLADARADLAAVSFPARENERGVIQIQAGGRAWTPPELSALVLREVWSVARANLGESTPRRVVITVPAYFDDAQRQATRDAARLADLEVVRIVNEPTAASLAYGIDRRKEGTVAVYDLGGGTFDVSILTLEDGVFRVLATCGDTHLGGDDLDQALVDWVRPELEAQLGAEPLVDPALRQALRLAAERCKIELTERPEADLHLVIPERRLAFRKRIARADLERLAAPLLARTLDACRRACADAGVRTQEIDDVVLVGGMTRIPSVRVAVQHYFGREPHVELDADEVVALGAAVQGHVLSGGTRDVLLLDVTPLSLGLEVMGGGVDKIIQRNSPIPCSANAGFTTYADRQTGIDFNVVQGERELARDCRTLGRFKLSGIPPLPAGMARVAVRFALDADGILSVSAKEESTGASASIEVQPMHGLTDEEIERMLHESYEHARADFDAGRLAHLRTELGTMLRAIERNLPEARARMDRESVQDLEAAAAAARGLLESADVSGVQAARDALEQASLPLAAVLMDAVAKQALAGKRLSEV
jgi:molecular chaperone DnaK (HSP70)